jgi:uncharacterized membrane protein
MARVLFRTELTPNAPASPLALRVLAGVLGGVASATAVGFWWLGAWPVLPFMGIEVGAALLLLRWHHRASLRACEVLELTERALHLTRTDHRGRVHLAVLEPYWLRVEVQELSGTAPRVWLTSHGKRVAVGNLLNAEERRELAAALTDALARWRSAPRAALANRA